MSRRVETHVSAAILLCAGLLAPTPAQASSHEGGFVLDGSTLIIDASGQPGEWVALYLPFAETTERVDFTLGEMFNNFSAGGIGGTYLPNVLVCASDAPLTADDDVSIFLDPDWLDPMSTLAEHYVDGSGSCTGPDIRGALFVLGGTVSWSYKATYTLEGVTVDSFVFVSGSDMQSWSLDLETLQSQEPSISQAELSASTDEAGWLHAEVESDPIAQLVWRLDGHAGSWAGNLPSGHAKSRVFLDGPIFSFNGWIVLGGFHEPAGTATLGVDMAGLEPSARIFFTHVPHLLDAFPFLGTDY